MAEKIQYGNFHVELSCYFDFKFLVALSDCQKQCKRLTEEKVITE